MENYINEKSLNLSAPCKVAIVGAGYMSREHLRVLQDIPGVELAGIYSRTRARAENLASEFKVAKVYDSIAELYHGTAADLVVVSVRELAVNEVASACFEHPWTVLLEKPAGYDVTDAGAINAKANAKGRRAYVALNRRHYWSTRVVLSDLKTLKGPRLIRVQDQEDMRGAIQAGQPELVVRNWMYANSIHLIDYFTLFGRGEIVNVTPIIRWNPEEPAYVAARISFSSGDIGLYEAIWNGPGPWSVSVNTLDKRWELRPLEKAAFQLAGKRTLEPVGEHRIDLQFKPGLRRQAELAVSAATGLVQDELPTLEVGLKSMLLAQAIYS